MRALSIVAGLGMAGVLMLTAPVADAAVFHQPGSFSSPGPAGAGYDIAELSKQDQEFLIRSHQNNLTEIITGSLAQGKGMCEEVRELGALLVVHHTQLDAAVVTTAMRHGVLPLASPSPEQSKEITDLAARSGADFDLAWLRFQITAHHGALKLGEQEIRYGTAPDVRQLAYEAEPILRHHLHLAMAALKTCAGVSTGS